MRFRPLASSSHGNAYVVEDGCTTILLECGITFKRLQALLGFGVSALDAVLVSHEHNDHAHAVKQLLTAGVPVYLSQGTAAALCSGDKPAVTEDLLASATEMEAGRQFTVGSMIVRPFATYHDAGEPLGFLIQSQADGETLAFAIDTVNIPYNFPGVNILALEANYEAEILDRCDRLPDKTKARIAHTHMEINRLTNIIRRLDLSQCKEIYLMHLSDGCSHEGYFINKIWRAVPHRIKVTACPR